MNTHATFPRKIARIAGATSLLILIVLFLAPGTFAAKPGSDTCKPHPKNPDSCGPTGDGMAPGTDTRAELVGEFYENGPRNCLSEESPLPERGNYQCAAPGSVAMSFHRLGNPVASSKKLDWMCDVLNVDFNGEHLGLATDSYIYGWTDACDDGGCGVEIRLVSSDPLIRTITFQKSDQMEVTLFADARNLDENQPANHYPFDEELMLQVHSIEVDYKKTGSTRSAVICNYDLSEAEGLIMFASDPEE
jgi:hypothetical protein